MRLTPKLGKTAKNAYQAVLKELNCKTLTRECRATSRGGSEGELARHAEPLQPFGGALGPNRRLFDELSRARELVEGALLFGNRKSETKPHTTPPGIANRMCEAALTTRTSEVSDTVNENTS